MQDEIYLSLESGRDFKAYFISHEELENINVITSFFREIIASNLEIKEYDNIYNGKGFKYLRYYVKYPIQIWQPPKFINGKKVNTMNFTDDLGNFIYPLYIARFQVNENSEIINYPKYRNLNKYIIMIAAPFFTLLPYLNEYLKFYSSDPIYFKLNLKKLVDNLNKNKNVDTNFKLILYQGKPTSGFLGTCKISIRSRRIKFINYDEQYYIKSLVNEELFNNFQDNNIMPELVKLLYEYSNKDKLSFYIDMHGNATFYMRKEGSNLYLFQYLIRKLINYKLMEATNIFPPSRGEIE